MNKQLDEQLCRDFPEIFRDRHGSMATTAMCWGFDVGDGWEPMIRLLCSQIMQPVRRARDRVEDHERMCAETPQDQWSDWMRRELTQEKLDEKRQELARALEQIPVAVQVKEKFGGLRFYISGGDDRVWDLIAWAESLSYHVCQDCSTMRTARLRNHGWMVTLCDACAITRYGEDETNDHEQGE